MVLLDLTGMVPSPDSILVRSWPRAFRLGCLSPWSEQDKRAGTDKWKIQIKHKTHTSSLCQDKHVRKTSADIFLSTCYLINIRKLRVQEKKREEKKTSNVFCTTMTYYLLLCYQRFLLFHQQAPSIQWLIECGCFLFSLLCATENTLTRVRGRLIRTTVWVSWEGGETDRDRQRMTKSSNY